MVNLFLFCSHFSLRTPVRNEKITAIGHAVDHSVEGVESCFSRGPLLNHDHSHDLALGFEGHFDLRNIYSGSFAVRRVALSTWHDVLACFGMH